MVRNLWVTLIGATALLAQVPNGSQSKPVEVGAKTETPVPEWRRSALRLTEQINLLYKTTKGAAFPEITAEVFTYGGATSPTSEVMRRFSGEVIFDGTLQGMELWGLPENKRPPTIIRLGGSVQGWKVFSKAEAVEQWRALPLNSRVRFKATIEGIGVFVLDRAALIAISLKDAVPLPGEGSESVEKKPLRPGAIPKR